MLAVMDHLLLPIPSNISEYFWLVKRFFIVPTLHVDNVHQYEKNIIDYAYMGPFGSRRVGTFRPGAHIRVDYYVLLYPSEVCVNPLSTGQMTFEPNLAHFSSHARSIEIVYHVPILGQKK